MISSRAILLLIGICFVTLARRTQAECCTSSEDITITMEKGSCPMVGGIGDSSCIARICADGVAKKGFYCGRGPCNVFGCNCECLTGQWSKSFEERNRYYGVRILDVERVPFV